jgi:hypothetical protein
VEGEKVEEVWRGVLGDVCRKGSRTSRALLEKTTRKKSLPLRSEKVGRRVEAWWAPEDRWAREEMLEGKDFPLRKKKYPEVAMDKRYRGKNRN